jgi:cellulose synthase/poly-beta-1,6-N-acetylglucosamine synthase-like glycosyltransferase
MNLKEHNNLPTVTVIIPALNSQKTIKRCIDSIRKIEYPKDKLDIIVVDNGSSDKTVEIVKECGVQILSKPNVPVGAVRNYGAFFAQSEILAHTDSDCILPKGWLVSAIRVLLSQNTIGAVGGGCIVEESASLLEKAWVSVQREEIIQVRHLPACNFVIANSIFREVSGFNDKITSGEDDDLSWKLRSKGYLLFSCKSCYVTHLGYPKNVFQIIKRQMWHGTSALELSGDSHGMLFATNLFTVSSTVALFVNFLPYNRVVEMAISILLLFWVPVVSSIRRSCLQGKIDIVKFPVLIFIFFVSFIGRSIGLAKSLYKKFRNY